jgi:hypothetical protein
VKRASIEEHHDGSRSRYDPKISKKIVTRQLVESHERAR